METYLIILAVFVWIATCLALAVMFVRAKRKARFSKYPPPYIFKFQAGENLSMGSAVYLNEDSGTVCNIGPELNYYNTRVLGIAARSIEDGDEIQVGYGVNTDDVISSVQIYVHGEAGKPLTIGQE